MIHCIGVFPKRLSIFADWIFHLPRVSPEPLAVRFHNHDDCHQLLFVAEVSDLPSSSKRKRSTSAQGLVAAVAIGDGPSSAVRLEIGKYLVSMRG